MTWRLITILGVALVPVPVLLRALDDPEFLVAAALVLVVPVAWAVQAPPRRAAVVVGLVLVAEALAWALLTRWYGTWAAPPTFDDLLRGYLVAGCVTIAVALVVLRRHRPATRVGLAVLAAVAILTAGVPAVGDARVPSRSALLPLPAGLTVVAEEAGCDWRGSCERTFEVDVADGTDPNEVKQRLIRHLERRGWAIGTEHVDQACRDSPGLADPYRSCASVHYLRGNGTVRVEFWHFNPREPRVVY